MKQIEPTDDKIKRKIQLFRAIKKSSQVTTSLFAIICFYAAITLKKPMLILIAFLPYLIIQLWIIAGIGAKVEKETGKQIWI